MSPSGPDSARKAAATAQSEKERLKREDHLRVKHDRLFSQWKILVGPSDWRDHAAGEEGSRRYKLHNLPSTYFGPGVYELGLTQHSLMTIQESKLRKLRRDSVVVVYLGQSENIRERLQRYGQSGSHLEGTRSGSVSALEENKSTHKSVQGSVHRQDKLRGLDPEDQGMEASIQGGLRLFTTVFSLGYSIAFRWARTESKQMAEKVESELLHVFDYPWNSSLNGARRPRDILAKLELLQYNLERNLCLGKALGIGTRKWEYFGRKVGISVSVRKPVEERDNSLSGPKFCIFFSSSEEATGHGGAEHGNSTCGVLLEDGSLCSSAPVKGRRRCSAHKGLRAKLLTTRVRPATTKAKIGRINTGNKHVVVSTMKTTGKRVEISDVRGNELVHGVVVDSGSNKFVCGVILDGGFPCSNLPLKGRRRCSEHKGIRVGSRQHKATVNIHLGLSTAEREPRKNSS